MKYYIAIATAFALLALTQAQDASDQSEPSADSSPSAPPFYEPSPENPPRPIEPILLPFIPHFPRPLVIEEPQPDNGSSEDNQTLRFLQRRPVFFDINFDFGTNNIIRQSGNDKGGKTSTTSTTSAPNVI